jgi:PIN domain nuclease of toxin-antitoxin system
MKLLLDTHILLWAIGKTDALSEFVKHEIKKPDNQIFVSAVSLWEIALKHSLGKLTVNFDIQKIPEYCERMEFELVR